MRTLRWFASAFGAAMLFASAASAADWMPLDIGTRWEYRGLGGGSEVQSITGERTLHGRVVATRFYDEGLNAGLENYWLLDPDGTVLLAGFFRPEGFGLVYEPPIRYLPVPPVVGPQPAVRVNAHDFVTDAVVSTWDVHFEVVEEVTLALPAGSFHSFGVQEMSTPVGPAAASRRTFTLDGRTLAPAPSLVTQPQPSNWFSLGSGVVQFRFTDLFQLVRVEGPSPVARSSWARVKRLYR